MSISPIYKLFFFLVYALGFSKLCSTMNSDGTKKIVITITSYNNKDWYQKNLDSVFMQEYNNYRVIYIDDASPDNTGNLVEQYINDKYPQHKQRVTLIKNKTWQSQLANHYKAAHMCDDNEIIVNLDGDDWFAHSQVFKIINSVYQDNNTWVTCGNPYIYNGQQVQDFYFASVPSEVIKKNRYRESHGESVFTWNWWHPRTFYAWLFKQIKLQDLMLEGTFALLSPSPDSAIMYPIFEMAAERVKQIPDRSYIWNTSNPISQGTLNPTKQLTINRIVASWPKYTPLSVPVVRSASSSSLMENKADIVIFLLRDWSHCQSLITSFTAKATAFNKFYIVTDNVSLQNKNTLSTDAIKFVNKSDASYVLFNALGNYCVLMTESYLIKESLDLHFCIRELERTCALAFYLHLIKPLAPLVQLSDQHSAWQFGYSNFSVSLFFAPALYRKVDLEKYALKAQLNTVADLTCLPRCIASEKLYTQETLKRVVGLSFNEQKMLINDCY